MIKYRQFFIAFVVNAIITSIISTVSIESRFAIDNAPNNDLSKVTSIIDKILYYMRVFPYFIAKHLGLLTKEHDIPEFFKGTYVLTVSFIISLIIYNMGLLIIGPNNLYRYFFGNL